MTVSLTAAIHSATDSCKTTKNRVILYICCSFGGSSEQLQGETLLVGEDTQGVYNEDFRKHTHRHGLARFHCHCEETGSYRGFSGNKSGHNHATD